MVTKIYPSVTSYRSSGFFSHTKISNLGGLTNGYGCLVINGTAGSFAILRFFQDEAIFHLFSRYQRVLLYASFTVGIYTSQVTNDANNMRSIFMTIL